MRLSVIQTSDDRRYLPMLQATEPLNRLYCQRHGFDFQPYVGMVRGCAPVHAAYNRIYLLHQRVLAGDTGWVLYMDADAWVRDMDFDVLGYLAQHPEHDFIAAEASALVPQVWAINNGVFFINLGSVAGQRIVHTWKQLADALVPAAYWADPEATWAPPEYDDQNLCYRTLAGDNYVLSRVKKESAGVFNYDGQFIAQCLRADFPTFEERLAAVQQRCAALLAAVQAGQPLTA